jgi:thiaminase
LAKHIRQNVNHPQHLCKQTIEKNKFSSYLLQQKSYSSKSEKKNIIITSGYATKPKERASCQLVGCNTNELKAVTHGTSHDQYSNMVANKTKEREIVQHVCCNT